MTIISLNRILFSLLILTGLTAYSDENLKKSLTVLTAFEGANNNQFKNIDGKENSKFNESQLLKNISTLILSSALGKPLVGWGVFNILNVSCVKPTDQESCLLVFNQTISKNTKMNRTSYFLNLKNSQLLRKGKILVQSEELPIRCENQEEILDHYKKVNSEVISGIRPFKDFLIESISLRALSTKCTSSADIYCSLLGEGLESIKLKYKSNIEEDLWIKSENSEITKLCGD